MAFVLILIFALGSLFSFRVFVFLIRGLCFRVLGSSILGLRFSNPCSVVAVSLIQTRYEEEPLRLC